MTTGARVLLVLPPGTLEGKPFKVTHQPIVAAYLAAAARRAGAAVHVVDAMLEGLSPSAVAERARAISADVVAVVPFEYRRELTLQTSLGVAAAVRETLPNAIVGFLNGVETSEVAALKTALQRGDVDFVALGDSEHALEELLRSGFAGPPPAGIATRSTDGTLSEGPHRDATDLNSLAVPEWSLFKWQDYAISSHRYRALPLLPVLGSRACPYRCDFCPQALFNTRQRHRVRAPESVFEEIRQLAARYRVREIEFYDATFGTRPADAMALCGMLERAALPVRWSCNSRCDVLSDELLAAMARAGCHRILFGVESGDQEVLAATGKNLDLGRVRQTFKACRAAGIDTIASFIIGLPGDTPSTIEKTIQLAVELDPTYVQFHLARAIVDKPRWRQAGRAIGAWEVGDEGFNGPAYLPAHFESYGDLAALHRAAYRRFYLRPGYVAHRLMATSSLADLRRMANGGVILLKQLVGTAMTRAVPSR